MVRVVWLNTSQRRRPRAVRPEGGFEGWCPAIPRGPLGCILLTTIMRENLKRNVSVVGGLAWNGKQWGIWRSHSVNDLSQRPDLVLVALFVSFGRRSSIKTSRSSSYSDAGPLSSSGSSPFELISEYRRWKLPFTDRSRFDFRFSSHVVYIQSGPRAGAISVFPDQLCVSFGPRAL